MAKKLFDHINHIKYKQDKNYFDDLSIDDKKSFNVFMILKFLSMDMGLTGIVNYMNTFQNTLSKSEMYRMIIEIIPIGNHRTQYLKNKKIDINKDVVNCISSFFNISEKKSIEYLQFFDEDKINLLFETLGKERD